MENPTTFHEIRGLSSVLFRHQGANMEDIQQLMAHSEGATTAGYQDRHALPFAKVSLRPSLDVLDGESDDES